MTMQIPGRHRVRVGGNLPVLACMLLAVLAVPPAFATPADVGAKPATVPVPAAHIAPDEAAGTTFRYLQLAGATFHPFASSAQFGYSGAGCIQTISSPENRFTHKVILPQGSTVKYVRLYYYDNSPASTAAVYFTTYDAEGGFTEVSSVSSEDSGGYGTTLSAEMNHVVDHYTRAISLTANLGSVTSGAVRFCGARIAYYPPQDDLIFRNGFD